MRIFGICLKYGPWRSSLKEAYEDLRSSSGLSSVVRLSRAEFCLEVLRKLCKSMHGVVHDAWIENVGRRIGFCSGPVPFLTSLGVIKKRSSKGQGGWVLGKDTTRRKQLCNSRFEKRAALAKIERWMTFAEVVASHTAPRTCTQWVHSFHSLLATLRGGIVVRSLGGSMSCRRSRLRHHVARRALACCAGSCSHDFVQPRRRRLAAKLAVAARYCTTFLR